MISTHIRLVNLAMRLCVYVCVVIEDMYTFKTGSFIKEPLCLCCCCCRKYVDIQEWEFWQRDFVFIPLLLFKLCRHLRLGILETSICACVCVVVEGIYT